MNSKSAEKCQYEELRLLNMKRNFQALESIGIRPKIPEFMKPRVKPIEQKMLYKEERKRNCPNPMFKDVTLKPFGQNSNTGSRNASLTPQGSDLKKFVEMVQASSTTMKKRTAKVEQHNINTLKGKEWIGIFLTKAEDFLKKLDVFTGTSSVSNIIEKHGYRRDKFRNLRRNIPKKCYREEDISSEDEYLHCDECDSEYKGACPKHGPMVWVCDKKVSRDNRDKACGTLPGFLSISRSAIPKVGLGIWTEEALVQGMVFGPYKGRFDRNSKESQRSGYAWQVRKGSRAHHLIEGKDKSNSNWLRFVNCADREERQSLMAFQYQKKIYYKTYKAILPFTELLVWYGNDFAKDLGIDITRKGNISPPREIPGFECDICHRLYSSSDVLGAHRMTHSHLQSDRRHACSHCPYSTNRMGDLRRHLLTHTGERPHKCTLCPKAFTQRIHLQEHIRIHEGLKPFSCSTCSMEFTVSSHLRRHERTHTGQKPFRCSTCGRDFTLLSSLKRHERVHTLQKPYRCTYCEYRSSQCSNLKEHVVRKHTRDFKHVCSLCGKGFISPSKLKKHTLERHNLKQIN